MFRGGSPTWRGAVLLGALGCGAPRSGYDAATDPVASTPPPVLDAAAIQAVIADVSAARQLPATRPIDVVVLDRDAFVVALRGDEAAAGPAPSAALSPEAGFLLGFDFLPPPAARASIRTVDEVLAEQVAGFYDLEADEIVMPAIAHGGADEARQQRAVLAHEVHHALQARHFPHMREAGDDEDERLARLALVEGDAQVAMSAYLALENGVPVGRALRQVLDVNRDVPLGRVAHGEDREALDGALALTRDRLVFPYEAGALFVTDLYRAGGFPLVNRAYEDPPTTTEQILHPAKFVAGEMARPVKPIPPPPGFDRIHDDTLGELQTKTLFARCATRSEEAAPAAAGWGGDRFGVFVGPRRSVVLGWVSAWDSELDASEAEALLTTRRGDCFRDNALGPDPQDFRVTPEIVVRRRGDILVVTRGLADASREAWIASLFGAVEPAPPPRPRFDVVIAPRTPLGQPRPGRIEGDVWRNDWLGLVARIPPGLTATPDEAFDLLIQRRDVLVRGGVALSPRVVSPRYVEETFREVGEAIAAEAARDGARVRVVESGDVTTRLGAGVRRTWRIENTPVEVRFLLLPICAQTGSILIVQVYGDAHARTVLDGWLDSFRWIDGRAVPACSYLDPK